MRELREDEGLKREAEQQGISKGDMQVWLSKKGGETWATMSAEDKKVGRWRYTRIHALAGNARADEAL